MKNRLKAVMASLVAFASMSLFSCNALHIHEYEWKYDEDHHWQECVHCGDRIGVTDHKMSSSNDTCMVCGYKDKVAFKDEEGVMTGLTKYAKTKEHIDIPKDVLFIGKGAIGSDSAATDITLYKSTVGICEGALEGSKIKHDTEQEVKDHIKTPEDPDVSWIKIGEVYYKYNKSEDKEAMIDGQFYAKLEDAFASVKENNTTITLLKPVAFTNQIDVNYDITLEAYEPIVLSGGFLVKSGSCLRVSNNITYKGVTNLLLGEVKERVGDANEETLAYNSGSISFLNTKETPNITVQYVTDVEGSTSVGDAIGSIQHESILSTPCYAYGLVKMNKNMSQIVGLTNYGATLNRLTVTSPIKGKIFDISNWAFTTPTQIRVKIPLKDIKINLDLQKGAYRHLVLGDGIRNIGYRAFSNWHDKSQIPSELIASLAAIIAPLTTVEINSSTLEYIGDSAFYFCAGLDSVSSKDSPSLKTMGVAVFQECFNLKNVDLSGCTSLERVKKHAFMGDTVLTNLILPSDVGWEFSLGFGYLPKEIGNPATAAFLAVHVLHEQEWVRNINAKFCYYNPAAKDKEGRYSHVYYTNDFAHALDESNDGYVISACSADSRFDSSINLNKSLKLNVCNGYEGAKLGEVNVAPGKYAIIDSKLLQDQTCINLKCDGKDNEFKNVSGVAISNDVNSKSNDDYEVSIRNSNNQSLVPLENLKMCNLDDGNAYKAFGLFNFKRGDGAPEKLNSLSNLGKKTTELELSKQLADGDITVALADNLFAGNDHIRKVTFGEGIHTIPRHTLADNISNTIEEAVYKYVKDFNYRAFAGCKKLSVVDFSSDTNLEVINEQAFTDCPNLKEVVLPNDCRLKKIGKNAFNNTGLTKFDFANIKDKWKAGSHAFNDTELTPEVAAKYLKNDYKSVEWTRA